MPNFIDDKSQYCIPFILEQLEIYHDKYGGEARAPPFFIGMNGVQGAGKTTLVNNLASTLRSPPHSLPTVVLSLDDLYLPHDVLTRLAAFHPENPLVQHRGPPSTHDIPLALSFFAALREGRPTRIPQYDKSRYQGQGDRVDKKDWEPINEEGMNKIKVVILEGWGVGFRALGGSATADPLRQKWEKAVAQRKQEGEKYQGRLGWQRLEDVRFIDEALAEYGAMTDQLDAFVHIDAEDLRYVYGWRLEQEVALRAAKGSGMTDEQVKTFVDGYYPSYELYTEQLRKGVFEGQTGKQLRLIIGKDRKVKEVMKI